MTLPTVDWAFLHEWRVILCGPANAIRAVSFDSGLCQVHSQSYLGQVGRDFAGDVAA